MAQIRTDSFRRRLVAKKTEAEKKNEEKENFLIF